MYIALLNYHNITHEILSQTHIVHMWPVQEGCFQQWKQRWDKCTVSNGEYFEGDHIDVS